MYEPVFIYCVGRYVMVQVGDEDTGFPEFAFGFDIQGVSCHVSHLKNNLGEDIPNPGGHKIANRRKERDSIRD